MIKQANRKKGDKGKAQETHIDTKTDDHRHRNPVKSKTTSHYILDSTDHVQSK